MNNNVNTDFSFTINSVQFNEDYRPSDNTRITTNFANLARGQRRKENLRDALSMINNRFNALAGIMKVAIAMLSNLKLCR